jgi:hypothetical protein
MEPKMDPSVVLPAIATVAMAMVVLPAAGRVWLRSRKPFTVHCPDAQLDVSVKIDSRRALLAVVRNVDQVVTACSLWPDRSDCDRLCTGSIRCSP